MSTPERIAGLIEKTVRAVSSPAISGIAALNRWRLPPRDTPHPMLTGLNAPMTDERAVLGR